MAKFPYPGKYTFVDVEIPNLNNDCICAISIIVFDEGKEIVRTTELINPLTFFSTPNIRIHHIQREDVISARTLEQFWKDYRVYFEEPYIIGAHNAMSDISVLNKDLARLHTEIHSTQYIDTMDVMEQFYYKGNQGKGDLKLSNIAEHLGIELDHHNPQSDVNCCCEIIRYMHDHYDMDLAPFIHKIRKTKFKPNKHKENPTPRQMKSYLSYVHKQLHTNAPSTRPSASQAKRKGDQCFEDGDIEGVIFNYELAAFKHWMSPGMYLRLAELYESLNLRYDSIRILEKGIQNIRRNGSNWKILKSAEYDIYSSRSQKKRKGKRQLSFTTPNGLKFAANKEAAYKSRSAYSASRPEKDLISSSEVPSEHPVTVISLPDDHQPVSAGKRNLKQNASPKQGKNNSNPQSSHRAIRRRKAQTQYANKAKAQKSNYESAED